MTKTGIIISNLGTPRELNLSSIKNFLKEFLSDPYVVGIPSFIWQPILQFFVLQTRPKKTLHAYQQIWTPKGSPLAVISQQQLTELQKIFAHKKNIYIELGMRYGEPSLKSAFEKLQAKEVDNLIILPLYPQYSLSTTGSTFEKIKQIIIQFKFKPKLILINDYFNNEFYIDALKNSVENFWNLHSRGEKLLISFHGIPATNVVKDDPYYFQCLKTAELLANKLSLRKDEYLVVFQSRFGAQKWLQPYCDATLLSFAQQGYKNIDIICPGFAADCLETLEEVSIRYKNLFQNAGGKKLNYIPALNTDENHLIAIKNIISKYL